MTIAVSIAAGLLFLGLLLLKIAISVSTILVFVGMPLAIVLWPAAPWVARIAGRALIVCLAVPVLWALCFAASGAVGVDALAFTGGGAIDKLVQPLVAIVLLWVTVKLPVTLARVAMLGAQALGGGFVSRAVSYAAGSQLRDTIREHAGANKPTSRLERVRGERQSYCRAATQRRDACGCGRYGRGDRWCRRRGASLGAAGGGAATATKADSAASNGAGGAGSSRGLHATRDRGGAGGRPWPAERHVDPGVSQG